MVDESVARYVGAAMVVIATLAGPGHAGNDDGGLIEVATGRRQWTGIAVSARGRVFVNFPRWQPDVPISVGELDRSGTVSAYPNERLNSWKQGDDAAKKFVCVQSVHIDRLDRLWVLDPANPMFRGVVAPGPKLVRIDLSRNEVVETHLFDETIAPAGSYLNDVRIDTRTGTAYITDSGLGAIIVVDLETGRSRRLLGDHPSTKAEKTTVKVAGQPVTLVVHADGIALDQNGGWLYYQALTGRTMYRVPTSALLDEVRSSAQLAKEVERFADSGVSDGLLFGPAGIYVSSLEDNSIKAVDGKGRVSTLVEDPRISWPDSFALGADGSVWFTTSQIHLGPSPQSPYRIMKLPPPKQ